jgi:hypothetical protein
MKSSNILLIIVVAAIGFCSCTITGRVGSMNIEIMKPGIFRLPDSIRTVSVFRRDALQSDTFLVAYIDENRVKIDSLTKYSELSNKCVDALTGYLREKSSFSKVRNYRDSLNYLFRDPNRVYSNHDIINLTKSDMCVFLDFFHLNNSLIKTENETYFLSVPAIRWTIAYKNDSNNIYYYTQRDTLIFRDKEFATLRMKESQTRVAMSRGAKMQGEFFGTKIIPDWIQVSRLYYKSGNPQMVQAEKMALKGDWRSAARIWNKQAANKNKNIAAKAKFNMALACEMEGRPDLAISWLSKTYNEYKGAGQIVHKVNCQNYINVLAMRKVEITRLQQQIAFLKDSLQ